jgi:hypothetical protein
VYELTIEMPNLGADAGVQIGGLGTFPNNSSTIIDDEAHDRFRSYQGTDGEKSDTLLRLSKNMYGVTVRKLSAEEVADLKAAGEAQTPEPDPDNPAPFISDDLVVVDNPEGGDQQ